MMNLDHPLPMLNRELPADGWFHVVPRGEFDHAESGTKQVLDDAALEAMANNFTGELLVDQDHFSYQPDKPSTAMGWIKQLAKRADGLWAKIEFTPPGLDAVKNGLYRFVSPVWARADTEDLGHGRLRPLRLDSVGLTNSPNLKGMVPLSNRQQQTDGAPGGRALPTHGGRPMKDKLIPVLGLAADAADSAVVEAVTQLKNRIVALEESNATIKASNRALLEAQVEADLAKYADRIANKDAMKKALLANRADTIALLEAITPPAAPALHNRATAKTPGQNGAAQKSPAQQAEELIRAKMLANRCGYRAAFEAVAAEKPELFAVEAKEES
jgi:phage I-like protein